MQRRVVVRKWQSLIYLNKNDKDFKLETTKVLIFLELSTLLIRRSPPSTSGGAIPIKNKKAGPLTTHVNNQHRIPKKLGK